ncbi:Guanine nucleotide exchange factor VAV3 [Takifugu flavidus]|uniref:Guanine nucleotide exchange factor VAV3 n=1 Tax=Takifugu flavidus TaxID=433684 RepID=A0A5C6NWF1_9TELE|nr:Guanine nucleotide exchange factor VAV3 [Takifugu flavidus]
MFYSVATIRRQQSVSSQMAGNLAGGLPTNTLTLSAAFHPSTLCWLSPRQPSFILHLFVSICLPWSYGFYLTHKQGQSGFEFFFKTKELKKKWLEQFGMAISNILPENATNNFHDFHMHTFERITSCNSCQMLLRGVFNQGYLCSKCGLGAHKECLGRFSGCGKTAPCAAAPAAVRRDGGKTCGMKGELLKLA